MQGEWKIDAKYGKQFNVLKQSEIPMLQKGIPGLRSGCLQLDWSVREHEYI